VTDLARDGVTRVRTVGLPPEAEPLRDEVRAFAERISGLDTSGRREALIESGYVMPHSPTPWGRDAGAVEQLVIEQEFTAAGATRPQYSITGWVILTLIQHATEDQVARWVLPALRQEVIWCQLFSEPDAGSDAAGIKTRGTRAEGGWLVSGQKVWTSGAHYASFGLTTIRTDPDAPKHEGITTMVIDMHADGVEVRSLRMVTGQSEFNEVFFNDVFVPDDDVVGPVNGGWTVARATLGNESVSIGGGEGGGRMQGAMVVPAFDAHPERLRRGRPDRPPLRAHRGHGRPQPARGAPFHGAHAPGHVHRRGHLGDQAQPDRRAHPRPAARPAHQLNRAQAVPSGVAPPVKALGRRGSPPPRWGRPAGDPTGRRWTSRAPSHGSVGRSRPGGWRARRPAAGCRAGGTRRTPARGPLAVLES
jgi:Acyl-CoA dehydrogenase, middle domain/Acyl-CoA dehydrogenase, N-terminal domain